MSTINSNEGGVGPGQIFKNTTIDQGCTHDCEASAMLNSKSVSIGNYL